MQGEPVGVSDVRFVGQGKYLLISNMNEKIGIYDLKN